MVDRPQPISKRRDRRVVGDVHDLGTDPGVPSVLVGIGQFGFVSSGDDDSGSL
jgi:hypothetical protein